MSSWAGIRLNLSPSKPNPRTLFFSFINNLDKLKEFRRSTAVCPACGGRDLVKRHRSRPVVISNTRKQYSLPSLSPEGVNLLFGRGDPNTLKSMVFFSIFFLFLLNFSATKISLGFHSFDSCFLSLFWTFHLYLIY